MKGTPSPPGYKDSIDVDSRFCAKGVYRFRYIYKI